MEKLVELHLTEREWGAMFSFMMLGIALTNGNKLEVAKAFLSMSDKNFKLEEVNSLIDRIELLGQRAFNIEFSNTV